jgi:hypothetical protein
MSTAAKKKTVFYPLLRIPRTEPLPNPLKNDQVLKAYINLFLRILKPMCLIRVQKDSVRETARLEDVKKALKQYIDDVGNTYNGDHLLQILDTCIYFLQGSFNIGELSIGCSGVVQDSIKKFMLSTTHSGYNFPGHYFPYKEPTITEIKPQKILRARALYQFEHLTDIVNTAVAFSQASNYSIQLSTAL